MITYRALFDSLSNDLVFDAPEICTADFRADLVVQKSGYSRPLFYFQTQEKSLISVNTLSMTHRLRATRNTSSSTPKTAFKSDQTTTCEMIIAQIIRLMAHFT